jgi:transposase
MGKTKYIIYLSDEEVARLHEIIETAPEKTVIRAKILLDSDFNNPEYASAQKMASEYGVSPATVQKVRSEYAELGLEGAVFPKGKFSYERQAIMTDEKREQIIAMVKGKPPYGQRRWTVMSICDECVKRGIFSYVAKSAIQKLLKEEQLDLKKPNSK